MLSVFLSPIVQRYTVTDIESLIPLIQKNVNKNFPTNSNITVEALDWIGLRDSAPAQRQRNYNLAQTPDLVLAVDCIYHPSLIPPLLATIDHFTTPQKTAVLVLSELRSEDVLREFIISWIAIPGWQVWHVGGDLLHDKRYVMWVGWKPSAEAST